MMFKKDESLINILNIQNVFFHKYKEKSKEFSLEKITRDLNLINKIIQVINFLIFLNLYVNFI